LDVRVEGLRRFAETAIEGAFAAALALSSIEIRLLLIIPFI
jgi:hypothetical protein